MRKRQIKTLGVLRACHGRVGWLVMVCGIFSAGIFKPTEMKLFFSHNFWRSHLRDIQRNRGSFPARSRLRVIGELPSISVREIFSSNTYSFLNVIGARAYTRVRKSASTPSAAGNLREALHPETAHGENQHTRSRQLGDSTDDDTERFTARKR